MNDELQEWQSACEPAIADLGRLTFKRMSALEGLRKMAGETVSIAESPEIAKMLGENVDYPDDMTHYLKGTDAWLNVANQLCTAAGIRAIIPKIQECRNAVANLKMLDDAFLGKGQWTKQDAWIYLDELNACLAAERQNDIDMARAGYE